MLKQYASCVTTGLEHMGIPNASVRVDLWRSMNRRYQQRFIDPTVDLVHAPWKWSETTSWILPCLYDNDDQRNVMDDTAESYARENLEVVFVADFPNMSLEHYVNGTETKSTTLLLLHGEVVIEFQNGQRYVVPRNQNVSLPLDETHVVHTMGQVPSRYMYSYDSRSKEEEKEKAELELLDDWGKVIYGWSKDNERRNRTLHMMKEKSVEMSVKGSPYMQLVEWWKEEKIIAMRVWSVVSVAVTKVFIDEMWVGGILIPLPHIDMLWREIPSAGEGGN
jgi:hypothetical protein